MANAHSRFEAVSRRAFLARLLAAGAVVTVPGLACGSNDRDVLGVESAAGTTPTSAAAGGGTAPGGAAAATTATVTPTTAAPTTAAPTTAAPTTAAPATAAPTTAAAVPAAATGTLSIDFTFAASGGGRVRNPYVAVWIEDASGAMVQTVALWFEQGKGMRWLPDLRRWYQNAGAALDSTIATVSSATRSPGGYSVAWDGTDLAGRPVAAGGYFICIEAAREHGPYELIREPFALGEGPFRTDLPGNGELTNASITLQA